MTDNAFDAITRRAAEVVSRRSSLLTLGGAALTAAVGGPAVTRAAKKGGKKKKKDKCKRQGGQCREFVAEICADLVPPAEVEECENTFDPCCSLLAKCKAGAFFDCVVEQL
jgi:hypothetical protein